MSKIDARGLSCPQPVILTQDAIESGEKKIRVQVDNEAAVENVSRLAEKRGYRTEVNQENNLFTIELERTGESKTQAISKSTKTVFFINSETIGQGDNQLGQILMKAFLYSLTESSDLPSAIILMNSGVKLSTVNSETIDHLNYLNEKGVEVFACGTCLDFYDLKEKVQAGKISNMYEILEIISQADRTITI